MRPGALKAAGVSFAVLCVALTAYSIAWPKPQLVARRAGEATRSLTSRYRDLRRQLVAEALGIEIAPSLAIIESAAVIAKAILRQSDNEHRATRSPGADGAQNLICEPAMIRPLLRAG
jgi:hypothetical protein